MTLIDRVLEHEGFRSKPYLDSLGILTIGHGLTYITEKESERIVRERLAAIRENILVKWPWMTGCPSDYIDIVTEMVFQMGLTGVSRFVNFLRHSADHNWSSAADEMLDSTWARQTPGRAESLADIVRSL